jgi:hypothetical protein
MTEMGLTVEKTKRQYFIAIPPFELSTLRSFFKPITGFVIDNEIHYDSIKKILKNELNVKQVKKLPWKLIFDIYHNSIEQQLKDRKPILES